MFGPNWSWDKDGPGLTLFDEKGKDSRHAEHVQDLSGLKTSSTRPASPASR